MIEVTRRGEDRVTLKGTGLDRSRYASSSDNEPPALHHNRGEESNIVRHCRQTAVALSRSRSFGRNEIARVNISGGIWLIGRKRFLMSSAFSSIAEAFKIVSSICKSPESGIPLSRRVWRSNLLGRDSVGPSGKEDLL